jgi:hypothetical protein
LKIIENNNKYCEKARFIDAGMLGIGLESRKPMKAIEKRKTYDEKTRFINAGMLGKGLESIGNL